MIGYFSRGMRRLQLLETIFGKPCQRLTTFSPKPSAVAGWGLKPSASKARHYARRHNLPYIGLEDAFIRSVALGVQGSPPLGLAIDYSGMYYDASRPSDLENLIIDSPPHRQIARRAEDCMALIRRYRLSKYNHAPEQMMRSHSPAVLVVDQTYGDASVIYGLGNEQVFVAMLDSAIAENPHSTILVKVHPDVIAGNKRGYLSQAAQRRKSCRLIVDDCNPWSLFDAVSKVYTVSSQLGFEALLANCDVTCFGMPFYAGWGVTEDRLRPSPRRGIARTIHQIFYAAYLRYCRYVHPITDTACELEPILDHLGLQRRQRLQFAGPILAVGFSRWKRSFIGNFLQGTQLHFVNQRKHKYNSTASTIAVWGSKCAAEGSTDSTVLRIEDGFLRSCGLGADLVRPQSLVIDDIGIYYDATRPSRLEYLLNKQALSPADSMRARQLRAKIIALGLTKYTVDNHRWQRPKEAQRVILVVGQVESDASIAFGSPHITSNIALLKAVRREHPTAYVVYKPHPDVVAGLRKKGENEQTASLYCNDVIERISTHSLLAEIDELHTMTSLMGFEALMRGVAVVCYGLPFYAGWGLTHDRIQCARRLKKLTLNELVFGALIAYPRYLSAAKNLFIEAEDAVDELALLAAKGAQTRTWNRQAIRLLAMLWAKMRSEDRP